VTNWKKCGGKLSCPVLRQYSSICLKGLKKTTTNFSRVSQPPGRELKPRLSHTQEPVNHLITALGDNSTMEHVHCILCFLKFEAPHLVNRNMSRKL